MQEAIQRLLCPVKVGLPERLVDDQLLVEVDGFLGGRDRSGTVTSPSQPDGPVVQRRGEVGFVGPGLDRLSPVEVNLKMVDNCCDILYGGRQSVRIATQGPFNVLDRLNVIPRQHLDQVDQAGQGPSSGSWLSAFLHARRQRRAEGFPRRLKAAKQVRSKRSLDRRLRVGSGASDSSERDKYVWLGVRYCGQQHGQDEVRVEFCDQYGSYRVGMQRLEPIPVHTLVPSGEVYCRCGRQVLTASRSEDGLDTFGEDRFGLVVLMLGVVEMSGRAEAGPRAVQPGRQNRAEAGTLGIGNQPPVGTRPPWRRWRSAPR